MKIITDNAVYVEKNDIAFLATTNSEIPKSIFMKIFKNGSFCYNNNKWSFLKFEGKESIEYFKQLDWIIDYNDVRNLSEEEFIQIDDAIADKKERIENAFNIISIDAYLKNYNMILEWEKLNHIMYSLRDILWFKKGFLIKDLAIIPAEREFAFDEHEKCEYQISADYNKLLVSRKDGKVLSDSDSVLYGFNENEISITIEKNNLKNSLLEDYGIKRFITDDCQYFVIQFEDKKNNRIEKTMTKNLKNYLYKKN